VCVGAGGHAAVVLEAVQALGHLRVIGLVDNDSRLWGNQLSGLEVLGGDERVTGLIQDGVTLAVMGIGSAGSCAARARAFERLCAAGMKFVEVIHPRAYVAPSARRGEGLVMLPQSLLHTNARVGANVLINSGACVEHDCIVGDSTHIATGAILCGNVVVGARSHIGAGAVVRQGVRVGNDVIIGAGAVVIRDVEDGATVVGNPAGRAISPAASDLR